MVAVKPVVLGIVGDDKYNYPPGRNYMRAKSIGEK